jgi:WD40 repeat protein/class 3 adenylate cyclase
MDHSPSSPMPFADLPEGTVTFLFTDIEGSTRLLEQLRESYATLLADQRRILRGAFAAWQGREVDTQGDAFFVAFSRATQAVCAAAQAQRALAEHAWPQGVSVRVRMGIHTGEPWSGEEGYVGMDVHRAARIAHVGHGGQVLLSETTTALVQDELPDGVSLLDLGRHLLKDIHRPERICQLVLEGLPSEFPPLTSLELLPPESARPPRQVGACPYRGLAAFQEADAPFYFGRESFVDALEQAVRTKQLVAVIVGSSGSGKSSALFAGLLPRLRITGGYQFASFRPGTQPFYALAGALLPLLEPGLSKTDHLAETRKLAERLVKGEVSLAEVIEQIRADTPDARQVLLVVDQFEELYTLCPDERMQSTFVDELLRTVEASRNSRDGSAVILLTLRADFMGQALAHRPFADALQEASLMLGPMTRQELRVAIEKPAEIQGAAFEAGLVERILDDVGEKPGNLPLLEFTLTQLWEQQTDGWLAHADYEAMGCVEGALAAYADQVYADLDAEGQELTRRALVQLVQPGEGTEDTRRIATKEELGDESWSLIQRLADKRLVVTGRDAQGRETAEVVHEALIQKWGRFQEWMDSDRSFRSWQERLRSNLRQWQESERDEGALLAGAPLAVAESWLAERAAELGEAELAYIQESQALQERRQAERQRLRKRIVLGLAAGLVVALVLAGAAILFGRQANANFQLADRSLATAQSAEQQALSQQATAESERVRAESEARQRATAEAQAVQERDEAEHQARLATSRELTSAALANLKKDSQLSAHLALQALQAEYTFEAENALHKVLPELHLLKSTPITGTTNNISYSLARDGELLFLGTPEGIVVQELATGKRSELTAGNNCMGIRPSLDGNWVGGNCEPNGLQIWEISSKQAVFTFPDLGLQANTYGEANTYGLISPSSNHPLLVFMTYDDMSVHVWEVISGKERFVFRGHTDQHSPFVTPHVFANVSQDGTRLVTFGSDGLAMVWDLDTGQRLRKFDARSSDLMFADFNPDGTRLVTVGFWKTPAKIWDLTSTSPEPRLLFSILPDVGIPTFIFRYSPDGTRLAAGGSDGVARVWDANTGELHLELSGHAHYIYDLTFSQDGERMYTWSPDNTLKEWDLSPGRELLTIPGRIGSVPFSPDGSRLVLIGADGSLSIVDSWTGELKSSWVAHSDSAWIEDVAWSPDGKRLATASEDMTAKIWEAGTGRLLNELSGHTDMVWGVDWSPDGDRVATSSGDGTAIVWDATSGEQLLTLQPDPVGTWNSLVQGVDFSPDGRLVATGSWTGTLVVWDAATGSEFYRSRLQNSVGQLVFCPDGQRLATTIGNRTILWKITDSGLEQERVFAGGGQAGFTYTLALSPDVELLAVGDAEGKVRVWDLESGQKRLEIDAYMDTVWRVAFSHDGRQLVSSNKNGMTHVHILPLDELVALTKSRLLRPMTPEECFAYLHTETCPPWP